MASPRQIAANRRNAQKSTGPKTQEGKARSRMNALKHGLSRRTVAPAPGEEMSCSAPEDQACASGSMTATGLMVTRLRVVQQRLAYESALLQHVRETRASLYAAQEALGLATFLIQLLRLERYERQALSRRSKALHQFDDVSAVARPHMPATWQQ